jgi:hypothetical protein
MDGRQLGLTAVTEELHLYRVSDSTFVPEDLYRWDT